MPHETLCCRDWIRELKKYCQEELDGVLHLWLAEYIFYGNIVKLNLRHPNLILTRSKDINAYLGLSFYIYLLDCVN